MIWTLAWSLSVAAHSIAGATGCQATSEDPPAAVEPTRSNWGPWVDLFDGRSIDGWIRRGGRAAYRVEDGCIVGRTVPRDPNTFLCTPVEYGDFELTYEFKVDSELNSGVQIRSHSRPGYRDGRVHGYQIEIDPSPRAWTGGLYEEGRRGWLQSLPDEHPGRKAFRAGAWNRVRVVAVGRRIRTWLNDVPVVDFVDDAPEAESTGFIGLQVHGVGAREDPLEVRWRGLRIREPVRTDAKPARDSPRPDDREPRGGASEPRSSRISIARRRLNAARTPRRWSPLTRPVATRLLETGL